jgi:hypothetical protein
MAVTVPVRRGGILSLVVPIPQATIGFHARAVVHPPGTPQVRPLLAELKSLLPEERQSSAGVIEVIPEGAFATYGIGVSMTQMRNPVLARARVPMTQSGGTS